MASCAAAVLVTGSYAWLWLPMAVLLQSGAAVREELKGLESNPEWLNLGFCLNQLPYGPPKANTRAVDFMEALGLNETTCYEAKIEEVCEAFYAERAAAKEEGSTFEKGLLFAQAKRGKCNRYYAKKADVAYAAEHPPGNKIRRAAQVCEPMAWHNCVHSTCPTYCALDDIRKNRKSSSDCNCNEMCYTTFTNMWNTGMISCKNKPWSECITDLSDVLEAKGRVSDIEAITREHILKCVCVNRMVNDDICYMGSQGVEPGKRWCDFNKNPSWARLLKDNKPSEWESDWKPGGHEPNCSRKEELSDVVKKPSPMYCIWTGLGLGGHDQEGC